MEALHAMASLSLTISRLYGDAPAISALQARKLKALKEGPLTFFREGFAIPSTYVANQNYIWGGRAKPLEELSTTTQLEEPEQEEEEEPVPEEDEQEKIFDHEFGRHNERDN